MRQYSLYYFCVFKEFPIRQKVEPSKSVQSQQLDTEENNDSSAHQNKQRAVLEKNKVNDTLLLFPYYFLNVINCILYRAMTTLKKGTMLKLLKATVKQLNWIQ